MDFMTHVNKCTVRLIWFHCIFEWIVWIELLFVDIDIFDDLTVT